MIDSLEADALGTAWTCLQERSKLDEMSEVTRILWAIEQGDSQAAEDLLPLV
jgi:hypothetical protein